MNWREQAACRDYPTAMFFPARGDTYGMRAAREVCAGCRVRSECLDAALEYGVDDHGVWGGLSGRQLRQARVQRNRTATKHEQTSQRRSEARRLAALGYTAEQVADRLRVDVRTAHRYLDVKGVA